MADIKVPDEILLPPSETPKEEELNKTLIDYSRAIRDSFSELEEIEAVVAGTGLLDTSNTFSVNVDGTSIEVDVNTLSLVDGGVTTIKIADDNVTGAKLAPAVAGLGLVQDGSGNLDVNVDDSSIEIATDTVQIKDGGVVTTHLANISANTVLGNVTTLSNNPMEVSVIDDDSMATASDTSLSTSESIKAYVDTYGVAKNELFTANGTFTAPSGVNFVLVTMVGGGAGGGGGALGPDRAGGGGGGGAYCYREYIEVTPASGYTVTVGAGGAGGAATANGTVGGNTSFAGDDRTVTCNGGSAGQVGGVGGAGAGGTATGSSIDASGTTGGEQGTTNAGGDGGDGVDGNPGTGGGGGGSPFGTGADGASGGVGTNATGYGAGGSGGAKNLAAGDGSDGFVLVEWQ